MVGAADATEDNTPEVTRAATAETEVDTTPTDAQKKAGNYKMGHIKVDGYNITIENPKGSIRSGVDSDGETWSQRMNNDYGYIRGTEGVDGDHIDVFLSDNPSQGNVYVIDQVNPKTGEFNEHKVMYGFNSMEEAKTAYLDNYNEGWKGLGNITEVSKEEFAKWIDSSHRKTKPFADYASVKTNTKADKQHGSGYHVSKIDSKKGGMFIANADGNINLAEIDPKVRSKVGLPDIPFRITESMAKHIYERHKQETHFESIADAVKFVVDVIRNADHIRQASNGKLLFSIENGRTTGKRAITVVVDAETGNFLGVSTAGYESVSNLEKKYPELWSSSAKENSTTDAASANVTSVPTSDSGSSAGGASNNAPDISTAKDTASSETSQAKDNQTDKTAKKETPGKIDEYREPTEGERVVGEIVAEIAKESTEVVTDKAEMQRVLNEEAEKVQKDAVEAADKKYKEQLDKFQNGQLNNNEVITIGKPGVILLASGIPNFELKIGQRVLSDHLAKHNLTIEDIQDLAIAIQKPIMVYDWGTNAKSHIVVTDITTSDGRKIAIAVRFNKDGAVQEINRVSSVHGKETERMISEINTNNSDFAKDNLRYVDKEKALNWLSTTSPKEEDPTNSRLTSATKVIESFQNPSITPDILQKMTVWHGSPYAFDAFDHSKMGTGEGAQVHGWGTYVAKDEKTGRGYAATLSELPYYKHKPTEEIDANETPENYALNSILLELQIGNDFQTCINKGKQFAQRLADSFRQKGDIGQADFLESAIPFFDKFSENDFGFYGRSLYEVSITDDNGSNYLTEGTTVPKKNRRRIADVVRDMDDNLLQREKHGPNWMPNGLETLANVIENGQLDAAEIRARLVDAFGSEKMASQIMSDAGFVGIKYYGRQDGECYVIFNENDAKIVNHIQFLKTRTGEVYGFVKDGKMYLDPDLINPNTPIHEYGHLWDAALQKTNPELWNRWKDLVRGTDIWNEVVADAAYADIKDNEDLVASEVKSRLTGAEGERRLQEMVLEASQTKNTVEAAQKISFVDKAKRLLRQMWEATKQWLADSNVFRDTFTGEQIRSMSVEDFVNKTLNDFAEGVNVSDLAESQATQFRFIGEKGARNADKAEGTTVRMDNLKVAEVMEKAHEEKKQRVDKLLNSESVRNQYDGQYELNRESAKRWMKDNLRGEYTNTDTGDKITISKVGINEVTSHGTTDEAHLKSIVSIPQMIKQSVFIDEIPNTKGNEKYDSYRYYVCGIEIDGKPYTAKIVVGVKGDNKYYDHRLTQIEKGSLIDNLNGLSNSVAENQNAPISIGNDTKLLSILQTNDKDFAQRLKLATGWERGADGEWRYEEPDFDVDIRGRARQYQISNKFPHIKEFNELMDKSKLNEGEMQRLGELTDMYEVYMSSYMESEKDFLDDYVIDKNLFKEYPELKQTRVVFVNYPNLNVAGSYSEKDNCIYVNIAVPEDTRTILAHEIQHAIQRLEGFAVGGNLDTYKNVMASLKEKADAWIWRNNLEEKSKEMPGAMSLQVHNALIKELSEDGGWFLPSEEAQIKGFNLWVRGYDKEGYEDTYNRWIDLAIKHGLSGEGSYKKLAGEVEARNVQERLNYSDEYRRQTLASETEDVPRDEQIVMLDSNGVSDYRNQATDSGAVAQAAADTAARLGAPVRVISDVTEITSPSQSQTKRMRQAKGWYDPATGEVVEEKPRQVWIFARLALTWGRKINLYLCLFCVIA